MSAINKVLETDRLIIRRATTADLEMFYQLWTSPRVMANVGFPHGLQITRREIEDSLVEQQQRREAVYDQYLVVELKETGRAIGECKMILPDDEGISRTDIKLLPDAWGHRYGVEVKRALLRHLFTHTDCTAVEATPNVENVASIKMQEAVGGVRVGEDVFYFPESQQGYTSPVHHYVYLVYRSDWERHARQ